MVLFEIFTVLDGISSEDGYAISMLYLLRLYIYMYMMACKCMINGGTMAPNACLSWPIIVKKNVCLAGQIL